MTVRDRRFLAGLIVGVLIIAFATYQMGRRTAQVGRRVQALQKETRRLTQTNDRLTIERQIQERFFEKLQTGQIPPGSEQQIAEAIARQVVRDSTRPITPGPRVTPRPTVNPPGASTPPDEVLNQVQQGQVVESASPLCAYIECDRVCYDLGLFCSPSLMCLYFGLTCPATSPTPTPLRLFTPSPTPVPTPDHPLTPLGRGTPRP